MKKSSIVAVAPSISAELYICRPPEMQTAKRKKTKSAGQMIKSLKTK